VLSASHLLVMMMLTLRVVVVEPQFSCLQIAVQGGRVLLLPC
jgi:hypothetical protein